MISSSYVYKVSDKGYYVNYNRNLYMYKHGGDSIIKHRGVGLSHPMLNFCRTHNRMRYIFSKKEIT
jgi:hypothetical protein